MSSWIEFSAVNSKLCWWRQASSCFPIMNAALLASLQTIYFLTTIGTVLLLSGGLLGTIQFTAFTFGILVPASAMLSRRAIFKSFQPAERVVVASLLTLLGTFPAFYARRLASPVAFDALAVLLLVVSAHRQGAFRSWLRDIRAAGEYLSPSIPFFWIPLCFLLNWMGFAAPTKDGVAFYGLFPGDFCVLSSMVSLIKASDGLPETYVVGAGPFWYHWFYYTSPAWVSEFLGGNIPTFSALALTNLLVAMLLVVALAQVALNFITMPHAVSVTVGIVAFAPLVTYTYQFLVRLIDHPGLAISERNCNLLSVVNSFLNFGNNTLAILLIAGSWFLLLQWNKFGRIWHGILLTVFLGSLPGYSVTLAPPVYGAFTLLLLLGRVHFPARALCVAIPIAVSFWILLHRLQVFGGPTTVVLDFDGGQFIQNFLLSTTPLWIVGLLAGKRIIAADFWAAVVAFGFLIPTCFDTVGPGATSSDFSMKIATLMIVAMSPSVAVGAEALFALKLWKRWWFLLVCLPIVAGVVNTSAYLGQFPYFRVAGANKRVQVLPNGYYRCLQYLRKEGDNKSTIVDQMSTRVSWPFWSVVIAERRVFLPTSFWLDRFYSGCREERPQFEERIERFIQWEHSGFCERGISRWFSEQADYLILDREVILAPHWFRVKEFDGFFVYQSSRSFGNRAKGPSGEGGD